MKRIETHSMHQAIELNSATGRGRSWLLKLEHNLVGTSGAHMVWPRQLSGVQTTCLHPTDNRRCTSVTEVIAFSRPIYPPAVESNDDTSRLPSVSMARTSNSQRLFQLLLHRFRTFSLLCWAAGSLSGSIMPSAAPPAQTQQTSQQQSPRRSGNHGKLTRCASKLATRNEQ